MLLTLATAAAAVHALWQFERRLLPVGSELRVRADVVVDSVPAYAAGDIAFIANVRAAAPDQWQRRCRVHWQHAPVMHAGEHWQLLLRLRRPRAAANPGRSLPALQLLRQGVHADAEVIPSPLDRRTAAAVPGIDLWRERLATAMAADIAERDAAALAVALAVGETSRVSGQQWQAFNAAGITHLVAISGLHVTLFAVLVAAAGRRFWRVCRPLWRWRRDSVAATLGTAAALGYALLAGFSVPT